MVLCVLGEAFDVSEKVSEDDDVDCDSLFEASAKSSEMLSALDVGADSGHSSLFSESLFSEFEGLVLVLDGNSFGASFVVERLSFEI